VEAFLMAGKPNTDGDGFWIGRLDEMPVGAKFLIVEDGGEVVLEMLHRDEEGFPHVMQIDF
jgi:hypothetical protein